MKLHYHVLLFSGFLTLLLSVGHVQAQISKNYDCEIKTQAFTPITGGSVVNDNNLLNFIGSFDADDGVIRGIPVGFNFDYNGNSYSRVNICVNGWASLGDLTTIPTITSNQINLFTAASPNNVLAPFWGDHVDRLVSDASQGFTPSSVIFSTDEKPDTNRGAVPGSFIHTFIIEWKDLNINDKNDPNATANFQLWIVENPLANSISNSDHRASIEFHYGTIGSSATMNVHGCAVGISDSNGSSFMNGLYKSAFASGDSTRLSTTLTSSCWPPTCNQNDVIVFTPKGITSGVASANEVSGAGLANYPNPFAHFTRIHFSLPEEGFVTLRVFDDCGREVATLLNGYHEAGHFEANFNGSELSNGIYEYRLKSVTGTEVHKMNLLK